MQLSTYVENLRRDLVIAAEAGGDDARALAERLVAPLESAARLMLLDVLSAAADEITRELAPRAVELRLRAGEPEFVVGAEQSADEPAAEPLPEPEDGATARINLRLPEQLKAEVEEAASRERMSVNSWLVRAAASAVASKDAPPRRGGRPGQSYKGWVR